MVDSALTPAIREAIKQNELGDVSPYILSFACLGASGASFGIFQGDVSVNAHARDTLRQVLQAAAADADAIDRILTALSQACPNGDPLADDDTSLTNNALSSATGTPLVDQMDGALLDIVLSELDSSIAAAANAGKTIEPRGLLYIALWVNMTGAPSTLNKWLGGEEECDVAPPAGTVVTYQDLENYLQGTTYFRLHPRNFAHMQASVTAALPLLPDT